MSQEAVICVDISGSVGGFAAYWDTVNKLMNEYLQKFTKVNFVIWDSSFDVVTDRTLRMHIASQTGRDGTYPVQIIHALKQLRIWSNICIITDGEVDSHDVAICDETLQRCPRLNNVECHIINLAPNLSVTCPFTRGNDAKVFTHAVASNRTNIASVQCVFQCSKEDYKILDTIDTITWDTLIDKFDTIKQLLLSLNMGTSGNQVVKDKLVKAKRNIIAEFAERNTKESPNYNQMIRAHLDKKEYSQATQLSIALTKAYFLPASNISEVNKRFDQLISLCGDLRKTFSTNVIASYSANRADQIEEKELQVEEGYGTSFVCPVLLDDDWPGILIDDTQPILFGCDKDTTEFILECPLRLLNNPELVEKCKKVLNQMVGLYHLDHYGGKNPFTRNQLLGVIPLGTTQNHIEVGNYTLGCLFTDKKKLGNSNLWFCVIYFIAKQLPYLQEHLPHIEKHLKYRLQHTTTFASLSGLVTLVTTKLSTDIALWYILASSEYQYNGASDPIRFHIPNIEYIRELVVLLFGEESISGKCDEYIEQLRWMLRAMTYVKRCPENEKFVQRAREALLQNSMVLESTKEIVLLDEYAPPEKYRAIVAALEANLGLSCKKLSVALLYKTLGQVHPSKSASQCVVDLVEEELPTPKNLWNWTSAHREALKYQVPICYATFRPKLTYYDEELGRNVTWVESAKIRFGFLGPKQHFNSMKYYTLFIIKHNKVPTRDEYISFCYDKVIHSEDKKETLPSCMEEIYRAVMASYKAVFKRAQAEGKTVVEIAQVMKTSLPMKNRTKMEEQSDVFGGGL